MPLLSMKAKRLQSIGAARAFGILLFLTFIIFYPTQSFSQVRIEGEMPMLALPSGATIPSVIANIIEHGDLRDITFIAHQLGLEQVHSSIFRYGIKPSDPVHPTFVTYIPYDVDDDRSASMPNYKRYTIATLDFSQLGDTPCIDPLSFQKLFPNPPTISPSHSLSRSADNSDYEYSKTWGDKYIIDLIVASSRACAVDTEIVFRLNPTSQQGDK